MDTDKPYRPNVGIALFNAQGRVFIARRFKDDGPEIIYPGLEWQMPQGGIDSERGSAASGAARTVRGNWRHQRGISRRDRGLDDLRVSAL